MGNKTRKRILAECKEITKCILKGYSTEEISKKLNYSISTVSNRIKYLFQEYNVDNRAKLIVAILTDIIKVYKQDLLSTKKKIKNLENSNKELKSIIEKIILNQNSENLISILNEIKFIISQ